MKLLKHWAVNEQGTNYITLALGVSINMKDRVFKLICINEIRSNRKNAKAFVM